MKSVVSKRMWTKHEDVALIECLHNLALDPHWKCDNGTFRSGYLSYLEKILAIKLPIAQMRSHPTVVGLRNKSFPLFDGLVQIFGKQRAIGASVEIVADAMENLAAEDNAFLNALDAEEKIVKDSDSMEEIGALNNQTSTVVVTTMKRDAYSKKRPQSDDGLLDLVEEMDKDDMLVVGEYISKEAHKVDFFFSLPKDFKKDYVLKQLLERNLYQASSPIDPSTNV
ncbi:hypothetical protein V6N11_029185 [Hibiscus sabdariffa]